jgi:NAD(P)-dependent dehydrogenase (short-subunit alcohol dehydrogenase family)
MDLDAMREVYETNVFGVIIVTNAMLPLLLWGHLWTADASQDAYGTLPW